MLLDVVGVLGTGSGMLSNLPLGAVIPGGAIVVSNITVSGASTSCTSAGEFSSLVFVDSIDTSVWDGEGVTLA